MPIPSGSFINYDISDPACYPGSGTLITDLSGNLNGSISDASTFVSNGQLSYIDIFNTSQYLRSNGYNFPSRTTYTISIIFQISPVNNYNTVLCLAEFDASGTIPFLAVNNNTNTYTPPFSSNGNNVGNITGNLKIKNELQIRFVLFECSSVVFLIDYYQ